MSILGACSRMMVRASRRRSYLIRWQRRTGRATTGPWSARCRPTIIRGVCSGRLILCGNQIYGAFALNRRVNLHAIDATPARWRGNVGSSPLDGASAVHPTHWLISTQVNIWEGHLHAQLQEAYRREGLAAPERTDMQARPNACDRRDVHFRMPGFPDLEVQAWFSLIATGLRDVVYDSAKGGAVAGCWHQPPRQKSAPWRRCQDA